MFFLHVFGGINAICNGFLGWRQIDESLIGSFISWVGGANNLQLGRGLALPSAAEEFCFTDLWCRSRKSVARIRGKQASAAATARALHINYYKSFSFLRRKLGTPQNEPRLPTSWGWVSHLTSLISRQSPSIWCQRTCVSPSLKKPPQPVSEGHTAKAKSHVTSGSSIP